MFVQYKPIYFMLSAGVAMAGAWAPVEVTMAAGMAIGDRGVRLLPVERYRTSTYPTPA